MSRSTKNTIRVRRLPAQHSGVSLLGPGRAHLPGPFQIPRNCPPSECGRLHPSSRADREACHWALCEEASQRPRLFHARFPSMSPTMCPIALMTCHRIMRIRDGRTQFDASLRDVLHGFDPFPVRVDRSADDCSTADYGATCCTRAEPERGDAHRCQSTMYRQLLFDISPLTRSEQRQVPTRCSIRVTSR